jgi:hypothetical protein
MKNILLITFAVVFLSSGQALKASSLGASNCGPGNMATYQDMTNCIVSPGVLVYSNFGFSSSGTGGATLLQASDVAVTPISAGLGGGFTFGLANSDDTLFSVGLGETATYLIDYDFFIDPGPEMDNSDLSLDPPTGSIFITQAFCNDGFFTGTTDSQGIPICSSTPPPVLTDRTFAATSNTFLAQVIRVNNSSADTRSSHIDFNPPAFFRGQIETTIFLDGTDGPASFGSISSVQGVTESPEPASMALLLGGLAGLSAWGKRKQIF